jgi:hypothetical protein
VTCKHGPIACVADDSDACGPYARYLGQQEGQSERDALRAEVEKLRKALEILADWTYAGSDCPPWPKPHDCIGEDRATCNKCVVEWAISEARKGEG